MTSMTGTKMQFWTGSLALVLIVANLGCSGHRNVAAETARQLHGDVVAYEILLNDRIANEKTLYDDRLAAIRDEEDELLTDTLEQARHHRCAELASAMTGNPNHEAQAGNLLRFLNESVQSEYGTYRRVREKELAASAEADATLAKIAQQREELARLEERVAGLGAKGKLRANNKLVMQDIDDLLDELENDQRIQVAERHRLKLLHLRRTGSKSQVTRSSLKSRSRLP